MKIQAWSKVADRCLIAVNLALAGLVMVVLVQSCLWLTGSGAVMADGNPDNNLLAGPKPADAAATQPSSNDFSGKKGENPVLAAIKECLASFDLTADQKTKLDSIKDDFLIQLKNFRKDHGPEAKDLQTQMKAAREAQDTEKLQTLRPKFLALMAQMPRPKETIVKIRAVLTPSQQTQFDTKVEAAEADLRSKMKPHHDGSMMNNAKPADPATGSPMTQPAPATTEKSPEMQLDL